MDHTVAGMGCVFLACKRNVDESTQSILAQQRRRRIGTLAFLMLLLLTTQYCADGGRRSLACGWVRPPNLPGVTPPATSLFHHHANRHPQPWIPTHYRPRWVSAIRMAGSGLLNMTVPAASLSHHLCTTLAHHTLCRSSAEQVPFHACTTTTVTHTRPVCHHPSIHLFEHSLLE